MKHVVARGALVVLLCTSTVCADGLSSRRDETERTICGDGRLGVCFDAGTVGIEAIVVDGERVIESDATFPFLTRIDEWSVETNGCWRTMKSPEGGRVESVERLADNLLRVTVFFGDWRVLDYFRLYPEIRAIRRWTELEWTGACKACFNGLSVGYGFFSCHVDGAYVIPDEFPPEIHRQRMWSPGRMSHSTWGSESFILAENGRGWSVLLASDCVNDYADVTQNRITERGGGLSLHAYTAACGYAARGKRQKSGDFWLCFRKGSIEDLLEDVHDWHGRVGHTPPAGRPCWMQDTVLYSTHPVGRGMGEPGGFPHAEEYLPYVKALGVNTIWLRPVEQAWCYQPDEMYQLQPRVGTEEDHVNYVRAAHGVGLRVWRDAVMHGGYATNRRSREHPEWLCRTRDGSVPDQYWVYDFAWPSWVDYFSDWVGYSTRRFELDGWRMDVPTGSRFPNWNPNVPYDRASYSQHQGGLRQMRAIRAAAKKVNPDACTLAEANKSYCSTVCDAIYDQFLCHGYFHWFNDHDPKDVVEWLSVWLDLQRKTFVPGTIWMRYPESHDSYPCDCIWGRAGANALMAFSAWIEGFPMVMNESEDGAFEVYRHILTMRNALPELVRGIPEYASVPAPPGVFACRRRLREEESVCRINFNGHRVGDLAPFGFKVDRLRGRPLGECVGSMLPYETPSGNGRRWFDAELRDLTNGLVNANYRIVREEMKDGCRYRVADFGGCKPFEVRLVVRLPDVGRWFAHAAEGSFESPFIVRHPNIDEYLRYDRRMNGAVCWESELHPFGFSREHASVGGVNGGVAYQCCDFGRGSDVRLWNRLGREPGLAVSVSGSRPESFAVTCLRLPVEEAMNPRDAGSGDPRLIPTMGGWQYESDWLRVRIRRTGAIVGIWTRESGEEWKKAIGPVGVCCRSPKAPERPRLVWGGRDRDEMTQEFSPLPVARFQRDDNGALRLQFRGGEVRGIEQNYGRMSKPVVTAADYVFDPSDGLFRVRIAFAGSGSYAKDDWRIEIRGESASVRGATILRNAEFFGERPGRVGVDGATSRYVYHDPDGGSFDASPGVWNGIGLNIKREQVK